MAEIDWSKGTITPPAGSSDTTDWNSGTITPPPKASGAIRRAGDAALALGKGVIGAPEFAVGVADLVTGGRAGKAVEAAGVRFKDAKQVLTDLQSPEQHAADAEVAKADGFLPTLGAMVRNPSTIVNAVAESAPSVVMGGGVARGALRLAPKMGAITAGAAGEGVVAAGQNAEQVRQQDPNGTLTAGQSAILAGSGLVTGAISRGAGALANKMGIGDVNTMLAAGKLGPVGDQAARTTSKGALRKAGEGAVVEGGLQELPQSMQEQAAQNLAQDKPLGEGVGAAGAQGLLVGGVTGGVAGPLSSDRSAAPPPAPTGPISSALLALPAPVIHVDQQGHAKMDGVPSAGFDSGQQQGVVGRAPIETAAAAAPPAALALPAPVVEVGSDGQAATAEQRTAQRAADAGAVRETGAIGQGRNSEPVAPIEPPAAGAPALEFDNQPTGTLIAGQDGVRPEGRSEKVNRIQQMRQERQAREAAAAQRTELGLPQTSPEGDILHASGKPFRNRMAAMNAARQAGPGYAPVPVNGGYAVRRDVTDVQAKPASDSAAAPAASPVQSLTGQQLDSRWTAFAPESGTKNIPRAEMPQVKAENRGALVNFLSARGITHEPATEVLASDLKPTQAEFSQKKVQQAKDFAGGDRSILVSSDGHVLDGHHQWLAKLDAGLPVKVIRLNAPIADLVNQVREFPSAETAGAVTTPPAAAPAVPAGDSAPAQGVAAANGAAGADRAAVQLDGALSSGVPSPNDAGTDQPSAPAAAAVLAKNGGVSPAAGSDDGSLPLSSRVARGGDRPVRSAGSASETRPSTAALPAEKRPGGAPAGRPGGVAANGVEPAGPSGGDTAAAAGRGVSGNDGRGTAAGGSAAATAPATAKPLSLGLTPNAAEPVTVKDGIVHIGKSEALNFDTGEPITVPAGATDAQIRQALKDAGAVSKRQKFFGGQQDATAAAVAPPAPAPSAVAPAPADKSTPNTGRPAPAPAAPAADLKTGQSDKSPGSGPSPDGTPRPPNWRSNFIAAASVARKAGIDPKGKKLAALLDAIDAHDANGSADAGPAPAALFARGESLGKTGGKGPAGGKSARSRAFDANPFKAFLGKHGISSAVAQEFAPSPKERRSSMVQGYGPIFRKSGKQLDALAQAAVEEGFLIEPDVAQLEELVDKVMRGERVIPQFAEGVIETEAQQRIDRARQLEEEAAQDLAGVSDAELALLDEKADNIPDIFASGQAMTQADADAIFGALPDENPAQSAVPEGRGKPVEAGPEGSAQGDRRREGQAASEGAEEGLTSPSQADILAQQQRARDGAAAEEARRKEQEQRARADAERGDFKLTGSDQQADANPDQDPLFKRDRFQTIPGLSRHQFTQAMEEAFGKSVAARLQSQGVVIPIADQTQLPDHVVPFVRDGDIVYGFYDPKTDRTYAVLKNLSQDMIRGLVMHEVGVHYGFEAMLGRMKYAQVIAQIGALGRARNPAVLAARASAGKNSVSPSQIPEETLAYLVQNHPEMDFVRSVIARIKAFLFEKFGIGADRLTIDDITALAKAAVQHASRTQPGTRRPDFAATDPTRFGRADQTETLALKKWFGDSKVVDADGKPLVVYHGTDAHVGEFDTTEGAFFFGGPMAEASAATYGATVMPVYLSISNPYRASTFELPDADFHNLAKRYDGAIFTDPTSGQQQIVAFKPEQIKSAIGNRGTFDGNDPNIMFSRTTMAGKTSRQYTPAQERAMANVGFQVETPTLKERAQVLWQDAGKKLAQGIVDQFAPVKHLSREAYGLLRLAKGASGAFEAFLRGGQLKLTDGVYDFDDTKRGGVVDQLLIPLQGEHHDFMRWVAANRAERLLAEGKENLFTPQDIADLKTLSAGELAFDYTMKHGPGAGQKTRSRAAAYRDSLVTFNEFNKNALDMAQQSGLIDGASRHLWEHEFYVPFYRVADDADGGVRGMNIKGAAVRQQAFKALKGGKNALNADLLDNTLMNWAHLLDAGAKNRAAKATLEAAERMGVAIGAPQSTAQQIGSATGNKNGIVWFMDGGQKRFFVVDDPFVLTAISSLEFAGMRNPVMNAMGAFKHALTVGVTASPFFKVRNLIRDSVQVIGTSPISANPAANIAQGWKLTHPKSDAYFRLLAGGGTIHFGTMLEGSEAKRVQALVESGVDDSTILNSDAKVKAFYRKFIEPGVTAYNELGNRGEAINRAALYAQLTAQGVNHAEASLQARDLMDFSMQGSFTSIRFLSQVVPFFNARIQGMYKLGRAAKEDPARFSAVLGATALFSLGLLAAFSDDDDWKKRELWDRQNFWWFKFGGTAFRIPKPFEIGAIATLAEHGAELMFDDEMTGKRFRKAALQLVSDNLSMNPVPQLVKPIVDVYANKDAFSGRPIETMGMEKLKPEYRFNDRTSMAARGASTAANAVAGLVGADAPSPVQIDHLLRGYFGWLGSFVVGAGDVLARPATGQPGHAAPDYWKTATGGMVSDLRDAPSRYVSALYDQAKEIEQAYGTWRAMVKEGKTEEAAAFREENKDDLAKYRQVERIKRNTAAMNQQIKTIERSDMPGDEKREKIRAIQERKDRLARVLAPA